ncbi:MAG: hypothetical protein HUU26_12705 [Gemmatimonadaceae bacterium]|nr:hypothetical protein [Gemmatimonadaceae bacterium]
MKLDDMYEPNRRGDAAREGGRQPAEGGAPLADREVPLAPVATFDHIHRWLDGEAPEPSGARGDTARSVEFWRRLEEETERRRRVVTPPYVASRIMAALPEPGSTTAVAPWWKKDVQLSPATIVALALGAFSLGVLAMRFMAR